ncbi:MAG: signal recognition particle-docking protein FtsY [candidate division WOR-3 bacterium]|jgi:fused signal recognition particle receptor
MGLRETLARTRQLFSRLISGPAVNLEELEAALLSADVGTSAARHLLNAARRNASDPKTALEQEIANLLRSGTRPPTAPPAPPEVIMIVGVNGSGKTTTVGKLSHYYAGQGKRVIVAAADTYRDAAAEQLNIWAERAGVEIVHSHQGQDAGAVAFDTITRAIQHRFDIVLVDTAGRLHTRQDLMAEVEKIKRVCARVKPGAPEEIWLVLDATVGQNGIRQAQTFHERLGLTGIIITKLDGTARGGIIIPVVMELKLPVLFIGTGEGINDLEPFNPDRYARALFE